MTQQRHGISIGIERIDQAVFLSLKPVGKLTHEDYALMTPLLENAIKDIESPHITALIDATEMQGWELRAAWDDFKLGMKHGRKFDKVAIFGEKNWLETASNIGSWFVSGEVKYFSDRTDAVTWLSTD